MKVRPMLPDEAQFVRETCCKVRWPHRWDDNERRMRPAVTWNEWLNAHAPVVDTWMRQGQVLVYGADDVALGFLLGTGSVLRMLYVKREFRGDGIGVKLVEAWGHGVPMRATPPLPIHAYRPTPSFMAWAKHNGGIQWEHAT